MKTHVLLAALLTLALPLSVNAHRVWLLPAATVLSGEEPWVTFDAAVSNDIFYFNHHPLRLDGVQVTAPDGSKVDIQNAHAGKHRSTFDLQLKQPGTYKVGMASGGLRARWETAEGERGFWPGRGETPAPGDFEKAVPKNAKNLDVSYVSRRVETFVTAGAPTKSVLAVTGDGFEMKPLTHPNDLYAGETAKFQFLIDGKPAKGASVTLIRDGVRYRNNPEAIELKADGKGRVSVQLPQAGRYWLEAEYEDNRVKAPATTRRGTYIATLEVLPQ